MSVTATVEVALTTTPWPGYPAPANTPGTSATVPDTQAASEQAVDNPSPEEELATKLASAKPVSEPKPRRRMSLDRAVVTMRVTGIALVVLIVTLWNSLFLVNIGEVAIASFGGSTSVYDPGVHFKAPWESIDRFPTSFQMSTWSFTSTDSDDRRKPISAATHDSVRVLVDMQATYRQQNLDYIEANWQNYGSQGVLRTQVDRTIENATQIVLQGFTAAEIWRRDARIEQAVRTEVGTRLKAQFGIELGNVVITDYAFNEEVTRALNAQNK